MLQERVSACSSPVSEPITCSLAVCRLERTHAVTVIERWWGVVKDKRVFHMLKQAICASVSVNGCEQVSTVIFVIIIIN